MTRFIPQDTVAQNLQVVIFMSVVQDDHRDLIFEPSVEGVQSAIFNMLHEILEKAVVPKVFLLLILFKCYAG
jgi:hypothetical protein